MAINYGKLNAKLTPRGSLKATMGVSGPLNSDYEALINKPQINGNELIGDKSNADLGIPTALEDLTDDSTHRVVTDEQISTWDNKSDFSGSYNDLTDKPTIPDELADLTDDSTHRLVTDTEKTTWNAKSDFSGSYNDLTDVPANLVQDANYVHTDNNYDDTAKGKVNALGTASTKNVPVSGDASTSEVVLGNDTRLTDDRNAKDVYSWAKASTKPSYTATEVGAIASTLKGTANGVAELDANGKVPSAQLPSYVDDVLEYASTSAFPQTGESGKIYIALDTNKTYRWGGSAYVEISESLALGETDSTAYAGNKGKQNADNIATIQGLIPSSATTSNKLATANDIPDISGKADKSEMSVSTSNDLTTIQLKSGTSATVINAHQDISGKANKSEMSVSTSGDKTTIQLKSGTSAEVLNQHQDISGKVDKVDGKGLSTNDYDDTAKGIVDGVTSALADKVDKVNGKGLSTEDYTTTEKTKLGAISVEANKVTSSSTNGHINIDGVDTTVYDDTSIQNAIDSLEEVVSDDTKTVTGNPINFSTKFAQNASSTKLILEPIQDLHGYDKPWVGGAGKNLFDISLVNTSKFDVSNLTISNKVTDTRTYFSFQLQKYKNGSLVGAALFTRDINSTGKIAIGFTLSGDDYDSIRIKHNGASSDIEIALIPFTKSGTFAISFNVLGANPNSVNGLKLSNIQIEAGSQATSYEPYENICPISGHDQIDILGCGKNILPFIIEQGNYNVYGDKVDTNNYIRTEKTKIVGGQTYTLSKNLNKSGNIFLWDSNNDFIDRIQYSASTEKTFDAFDNAAFIAISIYESNITPSDLSWIQIEEGSSATDYEPYTESNNKTLDLPSTVYGGVLDLESGELVVDKAYAEFDGSDDENWSIYGTGTGQNVLFFINIQNVKPSTVKAITNKLNYVTIATSNNNIGFSVTANAILNIRYEFNNTLTVSDCRQWLSTVPLQIAYELVTPTTIQLTPHQLNLLKEQNNISSNVTSISVTYKKGILTVIEPVTESSDGIMSATDKQNLDRVLETTTSTVEGNPLNFDTDCVQVARSTVIDLEPIQDLHGFTKPWVGGAGKNKLPLTVSNIKALNIAGTWNDLVYTYLTTTFTLLVDSDNNVLGIKINGTPTNNINFFLWNPISLTSGSSYYLNGCPDGGSTSTYMLRFYNSTTTASKNAISSGDVLISDWADQYNRCEIRITANVQYNNITFKPMVRLASIVDSSFEPYTNIASISGYNEVDINGCGKNLFNSLEPTYANTALDVNGNFVPLTNWACYLFKGGKQYAFSYVKPSGFDTVRYGYKVNGVWARTNSSSNPLIIDATNYEEICFSLDRTSGYELINAQLEVGNQSTEYTSYIESTDLTISFGQTVYGARHDVENGALVVDRKRINLGSLTWTQASGGIGRFQSELIGDAKIPSASSEKANCVCSVFESDCTDNVYTTNGKIGIHTNGMVWVSATNIYSDAATFTTAMDGVDFVYELATPITVNLEPHQIHLLKGINNISTSGDKLTLTYRNGEVVTLEDVDALSRFIEALQAFNNQ